MVEDFFKALALWQQSYLQLYIIGKVECAYTCTLITKEANVRAMKWKYPTVQKSHPLL